MPRYFACAFIFCSVLLHAQTGAIVGSGYAAPAPVSVAPGQIVTLFVDGLGVSLSQPARAASGPLPLTLAGITATLRQSADTPVPLVEVRPVSTCPVGSLAPQTKCASLTAVTMQIPYELTPLCPLCASPTLPAAQLIVSANGVAAAAISLNALADQVHVLTSCDVVLQTFGTPPPVNTTGLPCTPVVSHTDGSLVSASAPAVPGESLTAWVFGLGQTNPAAATGQPSPKAASSAQTFYLNYNYEVNALAVKPYTGEPDVRPPQPAFAGLAPGFVGLYQINFVVPPEPANGTPQCSVPGTLGPGANVVQSNLTVSLGGSFSFDGAGICIATTHIPVD